MMPEPAALGVPSSGSPDGGTDGQAALAVLDARRAIIQPFLRKELDALPPWLRGVAGYHLGCLDHNGDRVAADSGKAIRPTMVLVAAEAVGGSAEVALPAAAAVELAHNFSLIHDDVIDGDETRRHRATAWSVFGVGAAILAGDALLALAFDVLAASDHHAAHRGAAMLSEAMISLSEGQMQDLSFERRIDVTLSECLGMVERKTALLMSCACALGAAFGNGHPGQVERMGSVGRHLGIAFQLVDDLLGIWGDPTVTGKPVYSDLQTRKKTLPVVAALTSGTAAGRALADLYERDGRFSDGELEQAAALIDRAGGRTWSEAQLGRHLSRALRELQLAEPAASAAAELRALAFMIANRRR